MYSEHRLFEIRKDNIRKRLLRYTRKALHCLPYMDHPSILDIGCGTGVPSLELARLTNGSIIAIDNDAEPLGIMDQKIRKSGLQNRVKTAIYSIEKLTFPAESFDLIWAEGSIFVLGFKESLKAWRPFLKSGGFMVMHDQKWDTEYNLRLMADEGYLLISWFELSWHVWWDQYYVPLQNLVASAEEKGVHDLKMKAVILKARTELKEFENNPQANESVFYIMQKAPEL